MSRGLRILHTADSHIGAQLPARPRNGCPSRGDDFVASFRRVLERAREFDVDLVIHAGDVFDIPTPSAAALAAAGTPLLALAAAGIPVVVIPGNHERSLLPSALFFSHPNLHVVGEPTTLRLTLRGVNVALACVPCIRRQSATRFPTALAATGWAAAGADVNVLVAHQSLESAACGPASFRFRSGEDVVERSSVPAEFDYVALGHVHRAQALRDAEPALFDGKHAGCPALRSSGRRVGAPDAHESHPFAAQSRGERMGHPDQRAGHAGHGRIVYAGSPDRITFAEQHEPKGCVLIEPEGGRLAWYFVEHAVRPMASLPLDVSGLRGDQVRAAALEWVAKLPEGALAQVRLSGQATPRALRGLALAAHARQVRPDALFSATAQSIEFVPERAAETGVAKPCDGSAFDALGDGRGEVVVLPVSDVARLPGTFGTYAFRAGDGRLLYVGKARRVDARAESLSSAADRRVL